MAGTTENANGLLSDEQTSGKFEQDKDPLLEDGEEENLGTANSPLTVETEEGGVDIEDSIINHLRKRSEYKNWIKGLMDISLLTANANQLRHAFDLCEPFRTLLILLLSLSILLQLVASCLLVLDHLAAKANNFALCRRYTSAIGLIVVVIIVVNILAIAFWGHGGENCGPDPY